MSCVSLAMSRLSPRMSRVSCRMSWRSWRRSCLSFRTSWALAGDTESPATAAIVHAAATVQPVSLFIVRLLSDLRRYESEPVMSGSAQCDGGHFQSVYKQTLQGFGHGVFSGK